ncbi:MAG: MBL fold metallo-hydrolase [Clostridia bacterium]|nr:MBL fold metallo-hydrolase [Clostridia bacterium]
MKITYYGTGGGAGIPEIFCGCDVCENARRERGKNVRSRSQAVLDGIISIDFPVDAYAHCVWGGLDMRSVPHILVTHSHHDHFLSADIFSRPQKLGHPIEIWASEKSGSGVRTTLNNWEEAYRKGTRVKTSDYEVILHDLEPFVPVNIAGYTVHPLRANHAMNICALNYVIEKDGKALLWAHDTGEFLPETREYLNSLDVKLSFVSLDCNLGRGERITKAHMDIDQCAEMTELLRTRGKLADGAKIYISHIGHLLHKNHPELEKEAVALGMNAAYDGLTVEF